MKKLQVAILAGLAAIMAFLVVYGASVGASTVAPGLLAFAQSHFYVLLLLASACAAIALVLLLRTSRGSSH